MRKICFVFMLYVLISLVSAQFITQLIVDPEKSRTFQTLYPNEEGTLILVIENIGEADAHNITVSIRNDSDIQFTPSSISIGQIERQDLLSIPINVRTGDIDPSKTHNAFVSLTYSGTIFQTGFQQLGSQTWTDVWSLPLDVSARKPVIKVNLSHIQHAMAEQTFYLNVLLTNIGEGAAKDVVLEVGAPSDIGIIGESIVRQYRLGVNETLNASFHLVVSADADKDIYKIPISYSYEDLAEKKSYSLQSNTSIVIDSPANLSLSNVRFEPPLMKAGEQSTVSVRIENAGSGDAKNVEAVLDTPWGSRKSFVGLLEKDEDSSAAFLLIPDNAGEYPLNLTITYDDDLGHHTVKKGFSVEVLQGDSAQLFLLGVVVILIAAGAYLLLGRKK